MNIIVFGATGGTGRAIVAKLIAEGRQVTAFARDPSKIAAAPGLTVAKGDAISADDVARALPGHDAVVVSLGSRDFGPALAFGAKRTTPAGICEAGTRNIVAALGPDSRARVIAVTAFGVGDTRDKMTWTFKLISALFLKEAMADKERQEAVLKATNLDYVLVQPVGLTDAPAAGTWLASASGETRNMRISRADVGAFVAGEVDAPRYHRQTVALSG
ncbi:MAG: NAD(P)H-binding protein [Rhodomicrobium sp.]